MQAQDLKLLQSGEHAGFEVLLPGWHVQESTGGAIVIMRTEGVTCLRNLASCSSQTAHRPPSSQCSQEAFALARSSRTLSQTTLSRLASIERIHDNSVAIVASMRCAREAWAKGMSGRHA